MMTTRTPRRVLFLDSAGLADARAADASGVVTGITTNPAIIGLPRARHATRIAELLDVFSAGPVCFQLTATTADGVRREAAELLDALGERSSRLVFKIPAQPHLYKVGAELVQAGQATAFTAVYTRGQAICAASTGTSWLIPYFDRARRLRPEATSLIADLVSVVPPEVGVLAASLKSVAQAEAAFAQGAVGVTTTWSLLQELMADPLTDSAVDQFQEVLDAADAAAADA